MTELVRHRYWRLRLDSFVNSRMTRGLELGVHDCALFPADAVLEMTGVDLAARWRGAYASPLALRRVLRAVGGLVGAVESALPRVAVAREGDVVSVLARPKSSRLALGLAYRGGAVTAGARELVFVGPERIVNAWRVG